MNIAKFRLLYKLITRNKRLSDKRHPMFEKNRIMKIITYIMIAFWAGYLIFFGVVFANTFKGESKEACDFLNQGFIIFLIIDFFMRFGMQETPAQEVKPYKLLPIPTNMLMDIFLIKRGWSLYNLFFLFFFIPFGFMTIAMTPYFGIGGYICYIIGVWLMFVLNSYWYLLWRTLINHNFLYLILPVVIYAATIYFGMIWSNLLSVGSMHFLRGFIELNPLCFIGVSVAIASLFIINRYIQKRVLYFELGKTEKVKKVKSSEMSYLNRYGVAGEYLKLEIKSITRNNVVRKMFITGIFITLMFCSISAFTEAYDTGFMKVFICVYCFAIFGIMTLTNIMGVEGNYIDGLMSRKESVLSLLKAKYYFNCIVLLIPTLFMIAPISTGKLSVFEVLGCLFFTPGCLFPFLFILVIFNNTTLNLTQKMTQRTSNSKAQFIVSLATMLLPMALMFGLISTFGNNVAGIVMMVLGLIGIFVHPIWLKVIYKRFMIRRYENMSSFRATCQY